MKNRLFIRPWIIAATALVLVGGILFLGRESFKATEETAFNEFNQRQLLLASSVSTALERYFQNLAERMSEMGNIPEVQNFDEAFIRGKMGLEFEQLKPLGITDIAVLDSNGILRYSITAPDLEGSDFSWRKYFQRSKSINNIDDHYIIELVEFKGRHIGHNGVLIAVPFFQSSSETQTISSFSRKFSGVLLYVIDLDSILKKFIIPVKSSENGNAFLIDDQYHILWSPDKTLICKNFLIESGGFNVFQRILRKLNMGGSGTSEYAYYKFDKNLGKYSTDVEEKLIAYAPVPLEKKVWGIGVWAPKSDARKLIQSGYQNQLLLECLVVFILLLCFSYILVIFFRTRKILGREVEVKARELKVSHERLVTILDSLDALVFVADMETYEVLFANKYVVNVFGETKGGSCFEKLHPDQSGACDFYFSKEELLTLSGEPKGVRVQEMKSEVNDRWYEAHARAIHWVNGKTVSLVIATDITDRRKAEEELCKLSQAVEQSPVSIVIADLDGVAEYVNPKFVEVSGYSLKEAVGKKTSLLRSRYTSERVYKELWKTIKSGKEWQGEIQNRKKDGQLFWEEVLISPIKDSQGVITHFLAIKEDITLKKEYEKRLVYRTNFDYLTDLPNRILVFDRLSQAISSASRKDREVVIMLIDLDQFKIVNDTLGHVAGDKLLMEAAGRLTSAIRKSDTVARLSGDEFLVILPDLTAATHSAVVAQKILEGFSRPFCIDGREVFVTASIGLTVYPSDGEDTDILLRNADAAMYNAKKESRNTFRFFAAEMDDRIMERMELETHLRYALDKCTLEVHYQPVIDVQTGKLVGAEALLRWNDPLIGPVTPDRFIPIAEETGLIIPIGEWVLNMACVQAKLWQDQGTPSLRVSVNISSRQFKGHDLVDTVARALKSSGLSPEYLELEITEHLLVEDEMKIKEVLNKLREMGLRLSIDDFGTGYSALSYLKNFSFDTLKVDRSFVRDVTVDPEDAALAKAIIGMAHSLGLMVIGEGVETEEQLKFLKTEGCDWVQGFYFSKALPPEEFQDFARQYVAQNENPPNLLDV